MDVDVDVLEVGPNVEAYVVELDPDSADDFVAEGNEACNVNVVLVRVYLEVDVIKVDNVDIVYVGADVV